MESDRGFALASKMASNPYVQQLCTSDETNRQICLFEICYDIYECKQTKRNKQLISIYHDVKKSLKCKHVENALYFFEKKDFRF